MHFGIAIVRERNPKKESDGNFPDQKSSELSDIRNLQKNPNFKTRKENEVKKCKKLHPYVMVKDVIKFSLYIVQPQEKRHSLCNYHKLIAMT